MSTKGLTLSEDTKRKISIKKTKFTKAFLVAAGTDYLESILNPENGKIKIPSIVGYCLHAGISRSRMFELSRTYPEVQDIIEKIEMLQEEFSLDAGFNSKNSGFAQFMLKSKHNYQDSPQQLTQNNYMNINPDLLADALTIMNKK